jgi:predicted 3-demethylubiquinone-9 3-methyltransferase (glyoxalase superfamily)
MSSQMVPNGLGVMLQDKDAKKSERVMEATLQIKKIDIEGLNKSYAGYWK